MKKADGIVGFLKPTRNAMSKQPHRRSWGFFVLSGESAPSPQVRN
jgi:hypothetical protein